MEIKKKIVYRNILSVVVLICFGLNIYSHFYFQYPTTVYSASSNSTINVVTSNIDSYDEDQIIQIFKSSPIVESVKPLILEVDNRLVSKFPLLIWQPPKFC